MDQEREAGDEESWGAWARDAAGSVGLVVLVAAVLFAASGVWPPMVAVESGSMEPHMEKGDLVFIVEPGRYAPETGGPVVTHEEGTGTGYRTFGDHGDVIVFRPNGGDDTPIIHRAMLHVEAGENWYAEANASYLSAENCEQLTYCPAPNAGYITKGDANPTYDQAIGRSRPVRSGWLVGTAEFRIPWLGWIRLVLS